MEEGLKLKAGLYQSNHGRDDEGRSRDIGRQGSQHLDMIARQGDFFPRLAQSRIDRIFVGVVGASARKSNLARMGGKTGCPLSQQQGQFVPHHQRQKYGSEGGLPVVKLSFKTVLGRPNWRVPESLAQRLRREAFQ